MKKVAAMLAIALCLLAACGNPAADEAPASIPEAVPYFADAQVSIPLRTDTGYDGKALASEEQAKEILDLLAAIPLDQLEECEPNSVFGSTLQFVLENAEDAGESCRIILTTADKGGLRFPQKNPTPAGTICVALVFQDGTQQAYQGVYTDFPYSALAALTDAVFNHQ